MSSLEPKGSADPASPEDLVKARPWHIALIAASILILELAMIRQIPAEVHAISYFTNLILMATFFGLGLGCVLQRWRDTAWLLPVGLCLIFAFVLAARGLVIYVETEVVHYWIESGPVDGQAIRLPLMLAALSVFVLAAMPFVAMGQQLARSMDRYPRLVAYGWDIGGSLFGTLAFTISSYLQVPPWVWPPVLMILWAVVLGRSRMHGFACVGAGLIFLAFISSPQDFRWSPYYYVQYQEEEQGIRVFVNSSFHQLGIDWTSTDPKQRQFNETVYSLWSRPYDSFRALNEGRPARKVLVLGAGTGNDVVVALVNGAEEVVAVEIDPVILELGKEYNRAKPYDSPKVRVVVDDARNYLRSCTETFDIVIFGTIDSQSLLSGHSNLRLENYVYTEEALTDARSLIADGGVVAVFYSVYKPWLYSRIYSTVRAAFGDQVRIFFEDSHLLFNTTVLATKGREGLGDDPVLVEAIGGGQPSTDDWPFIYLQRPMIGPLYWGVIASISILIIGVFLVLRRLHPVTGLHANFLLLGMGFVLVESSSIVRLNLLFGSTWVVNAVVFAAVLSTIFLANWTVLAGLSPGLRWAWPGLFVAILINYFFPLHSLFGLEPGLRAVASGLLVAVPVFFAALCFSHLFARQTVTGYALGINLVGAMAGGLAEYSSMVIGMRAIWLIVLGVYVLAWLTTKIADARDVQNGLPTRPATSTH